MDISLKILYKPFKFSTLILSIIMMLMQGTVPQSFDIGHGLNLMKCRNLFNKNIKKSYLFVVCNKN